MNRHHRRAERAACRQGPARVPRRPVERRASEKEVEELTAAHKIVSKVVLEHKNELKKIPPAVVASALLDSACMFLAGARITGEVIDWERVRFAMDQCYVDHLNKLREKK